MIKLLIADDEPLVQIGLKSMLEWAELGIEICGIASNGDTAYELIEKHRPEIVITDIQMPCSSGLELGKKCLEDFGSLPVFIILTSYEDFNYAREAISFQALDYLVKIDLSPEMLKACIQKAIERVNYLRSLNSGQTADHSASALLYQERFYIRLLNNLFETRKQFTHMAGELNISFPQQRYVAAHMEFMIPEEDFDKTPDDVLKLYNSGPQMLQELLSKYMPCKIVALDPKHAAAILGLADEECNNSGTGNQDCDTPDNGDHKNSSWKDTVSLGLAQALEMLHNYYNVTVYTSIGRVVQDPLDLSASYYDAKQIAEFITSEHPLLYWDEQPDSSSLRNVFNMSLLRNNISKAFEELNVSALQDIFSSINDLLSTNAVPYSQTLDAASNILHFTIALLPDGMDIASSIFKDEPDTYCSLYRQKTTASVTAWLKTLEEGLCRLLPEHSKEHRHYLVENAKQYIKGHIHERIILQDIADTFGISPNYLSQLFKKYEDIGISEYITNQKINQSKELLNEGSLKIYEIADQLGFENAFYFSKVFKKVTGVAPKDYRNLKKQ